MNATNRRFTARPAPAEPGRGERKATPVSRVALLAGAGILVVGGLAIAAVLSIGDDFGSGAAPVVAESGAAPVPAPLPMGPRPPEAPRSADRQVTREPPMKFAPGVRPLPLSAARLVTGLAPALATCYEHHGVNSGSPTKLAVELESDGSGYLVVVGTSVRTRGGASDGLVDCAQRSLRDQRVLGSAGSSGDRFLTELGIDRPVPGARPAVPPPSGAPPARAIGRGNVRS